MLEQEIKLIVDNQGVLDSVINSELIRSHVQRKLDPVLFCARYHDTRNRVFTRSFCSLRSRAEGDKMRATFKEKGTIVDGLSQHHELESEIGDWLETAGMLPEGPLKNRVLQMVNEDDRFETMVKVRMSRTILELKIADTEIECAADSGCIMANEKSVPFHELELELKCGELLPVRELSQQLKQHYGLTWSDKTKLAIGMQLWNS